MKYIYLKHAKVVLKNNFHAKQNDESKMFLNISEQTQFMHLVWDYRTIKISNQNIDDWREDVGQLLLLKYVIDFTSN